jgi:chromosome transmission fidelity protein 4
MIHYRPHESWTARSDWRVSLPPGEDVTSLSLSSSYVAVTTTASYTRIYTLFGVPVRITATPSSYPAISCAAWRDYVLTLTNGPVSAQGSCTLLASIENVSRDTICQSQFPVALSPGAGLHSVLFSVLQHWRSPGQARWVPLLDTRRLERLATGRKSESYWPVAVAGGRFHCIILKGGDRYPYFPRPLLSEFDFEIPVAAPIKKNADAMEHDGEDDEENNAVDPAREAARLEELFVRNSLLHSLREDALGATRATRTQEAELSRMQIEVDKTLLQLLNVECREGEERGMKALEIASLLRDRSGKMLEAAGKIAGRYGLGVLEDKIAELADKRVMGEDEDGDELE